MDKAYFLEVFGQSLDARRAYLEKNKIEAYRLFNYESFDLPFAVDIYGAFAVIHLFGKFEQEDLVAEEEALRELLKVEGVFFKTRERSECASSEFARSADSLNLEHKEIVVNEYGHKFLINLLDYLDVGLFLDHRETRKWIGANAKGKTVLNTFAYTGSFSVYAAVAGAEKTYSVDLSKTYCEWLKKNLELNGLPPEKNWVYKMDTFEFFKYARRKELKFDIIIIDPPTFSRNKGETFSVKKDHVRLMNEALQLLSKGGFVLFSTNFKDFELEERKLDPCEIEEITDKIPLDFSIANNGTPPHVCYLIRRR